MPSRPTLYRSTMLALTLCGTLLGSSACWPTRGDIKAVEENCVGRCQDAVHAFCADKDAVTRWNTKLATAEAICSEAINELRGCADRLAECAHALPVVPTPAPHVDAGPPPQDLCFCASAWNTSDIVLAHPQGGLWILRPGQQVCGYSGLYVLTSQPALQGFTVHINDGRPCPQREQSNDGGP